MINDLLAVVVIAQTLTAATPLLLAGCGELVAERGGVLNIGIEGLMLTGCIAAFAVTASTGNSWLGLLVAMGAAMVLGAGFALMAITARADQIVAGMALNLVAVGVSGTVWRALQSHGVTELPATAGFSRGWFGWSGWSSFSDLPVIGPLFFDLYGLSIATAGLLLLTWWVLRRTRIGIVIQAIGELPDAAAAAGESVHRWRWGVVLFAAACAGAAGAFLSIMRTHAFVPEMTGGKGFVVLALVMFGRWRISWLIAGCLLFGLADSVQQQLQSLPGSRALPYQFFQMLPYVVALVALAGLSRSAPGPAALGKPWPVSR